MEEAKPTWYTAVPTMHQAILTRAKQNEAVIERHPLRFVRSSSSSLPPSASSRQRDNGNEEDVPPRHGLDEEEIMLSFVSHPQSWGCH